MSYSTIFYLVKMEYGSKKNIFDLKIQKIRIKTSALQ